MTTLRAATLGGGPERRLEQTRVLRQLLQHTVRGGFLFPQAYPGCAHNWVCLDSGYAVCDECGQEHRCYEGRCPETFSDQSERVCTISGCVTLEHEMRAERNANTRVGPSSSSASAAVTSHATPAVPKVGDLLRSGVLQSETLREMIEYTVREILASDKTDRCMEQERRRNHAKELAVFSRLLREVAHDRECRRPNLVVLLGHVRFHCRKNRRAVSLVSGYGASEAARIIEACTDAITGLLLVHGGPRVARQLQNATRNREFIASMLFLMRVGISFQGRRVLPRMDLLHDVLPLQVLLPSIFRIRAKSITEGENLIKLDLKSLPIS
jgi:hypothetical protein